MGSERGKVLDWRGSDFISCLLPLEPSGFVGERNGDDSCLKKGSRFGYVLELGYGVSQRFAWKASGVCQC